MNNFNELNNNEVFKLENKTYDIKKDECTFISHFYCTNSGSPKHNPNGEKHAFIYLKDKKNIVIDGQGARVIFHGEVTPILLDSCHNITIKNITFDYAVPSMSEFRIIRAKRGQIVIKPHKNNRFLIKNNSLYWVSDKDEKGQYYFCYEYNGEDMLSMGLTVDNHLYMLPYRSPKSRFPSFPEIKDIKENDDETLTLTLKDPSIELKEGDVIQTRCTHRNEVGGYFNNSSNIHLENVSYHFMNGMGLVFQNVNNISLHKVNIVPTEDRIVSSCADFFHFSNCKGKIKIKECTAIGAHDDVINVHGVYLSIDRINKKEIILKFPHHETYGFLPYSKDDVIEFVDKNTLLPIYHAKVVKAQLVDLFTVSLTIDKEIPNDLSLDNCVIDNLTNKPSLLVQDCHFERISTRGILATTNKNVVIKNNTFKDINGPLLFVSDDANEWFESGRSGVIKLIDNTISSCDSGMNQQGEPIVLVKPEIKEDKKQIIHQKLIIKNNIFNKPFIDRFIFNISHLKTLILRNNKFDAPYEIKDNNVFKLDIKNNS